jgi:hypothetical protein
VTKSLIDPFSEQYVLVGASMGALGMYLLKDIAINEMVRRRVA